MRYEVKHDENQLVFGSLAELKALYAQGFVEGADMVRPEGSERWVRADHMPALRVASSRVNQGTRSFALIAVGVLFSAVVGAFVFHYKSLALGGLVLLAVTLPFLVYRRRR